MEIVSLVGFSLNRLFLPRVPLLPEYVFARLTVVNPYKARLIRAGFFF